MNRRLREIRERQQAIRADLEVLGAIDEPSDEDVARTESLIDEHIGLETEAGPIERRETEIERLRSIAIDPRNRTGGSEPDSLGAERGGVEESRRRAIYDVSAIRTNPFLLGNDSVRAELVTRARDAIEDLPSRVSDGIKEAATRMLETVAGDQAEAAMHILTTGNPAYRSAFRNVLRAPSLGVNAGRSAEELDALRAAMTLTAANGGYLLPFELDPSIILSNAGTVNAIRGIARNVQTTQNVWHGVSSAGVTAEWTAEAAEAADASPTFLQPTVTCFKGDAYLQATFEFLADSNIENDIAMLIADAKARLEASAFTNGNGTTQPRGIITTLAGVTASRVSATTNGSFGAVDVLALDTQLPPRWRANASWLANKGVYNLARLFATGTGALSGTFWTDFGGGVPARMIGYDTYQASDMVASLSAATASNDDVLVLGDFSQYLVADRIGVSLLYEPLVKGANFRPTGQVGWYATWRVGGDVLVNDAFRMLVV